MQWVRHEELLATNEIYREVYESQQEGGSLIWQRSACCQYGPRPGQRPALEKPKNPKETIGRLAKYLMAYKGQMLLVVVGIIGSSGASVASTYFLKPIINDYIVPFIGQENPNLSAFVSMLCLMAVVYLIGVGCGYLYKRLMVNIATGSMRKIRTRPVYPYAVAADQIFRYAYPWGTDEPLYQ